MRMRWFFAVLAVVMTGSISWVGAQQQDRAPKPEPAVASAASPVPATGSGESSKSAANKTAAPVRNEPAAERIEGEKRFHANCGRCHMAPQKFPSREMATIIRHMRVRATITDEDMRLILKYMTQ